MKKAARKFRFTVESLTALKPPAKGTLHVYDDRVPKLALCVTSRGGKAFYRVGRIGGRMLRMKLGNFPAMSIDAARRAAAIVNGTAASGRALVAEKLGALSSHTIGELWRWYRDEFAKVRKVTWKRDLSTYARDVADWESWSIRDVTGLDVTERMNALEADHGKGAANKFLDLIRGMYKCAHHPLKWMGERKDDPTLGIVKLKVDSRDRYILETEAPAFFASLAKCRQPARDFLFVTLMTGARRANVESMRRDEVNLHDGTWTIPAKKSKTGKPMVVVLTPTVVSLLSQRFASHDSEWAFPSGNSQTGFYRNPKGAWASLLKRAGLVNLRIHDLRRTLASWQAKGGTSLLIIGRSLGHVNPNSTAIYARLQIDPVRQSVEGAAAKLIEFAESKNFVEKD